MPDREHEKQAAAEAATALVADGQLVGLGTGSTVAHLLPALAARRLTIRCVATSPRPSGWDVSSAWTSCPSPDCERLDIAIDGADQIDEDGWLIKGGGGAHTREKIVAAAADRFVVIGSGDKAVARIGPPVPLELLRFGLDATLAALGPVRLRNAQPSPDGGVIADYFGEFSDREELAARLDAQPGVIGHGIFPPSLSADVLLATGGRVEHRVLR